MEVPLYQRCLTKSERSQTLNKAQPSFGTIHPVNVRICFQPKVKDRLKSASSPP